VWAARPADDRELVPEREDLELHRRARAEQRDNDRRHESSLPKNACNLNQRNAYGVSARHSGID